MNKYLYKIKDLEIPTHLKYWFARKSKVNFDLSQILNGTSFDLTNTVNKKLHLINIFGNSVQNGEPTPENTIEVKSSGDNGYIVEKFVNKNFLNLIDVEPITHKGVTETINNKIICLNGTANGTVFLRTGNNYFNLKAGIYTLSANNEQVLTSNCLLRIVTSQGTTIDGLSLSLNVKDSSITFTINEDLENVTLQIRIEVGITLNNFTIKPQIEKGSTATDYEPHQEQVFTIPCQQPMRAIGDVKDTFVKANGVWYERHNIGEFIANNNLLGNGITDDRVNLRTPTLNIAVNLGGDAFKSKVMCNLLQKTINNNTGLAGTTSTGEIRVVLSKDYVTTYAEANTYLTEKGLKIYWAMEEPIDLPCTQAQITALEALMKARTYKDVTHIYTDDEVPAELQIQYYKEKGE